MDRLKFLGDPPHGGPENDEECVDLADGDDECEVFLKALRHRATNLIPPELLVDSMDLWSSEPAGPEDAPEYMYLKGLPTKHHDQFQHWINVVK